jgi:hypothetical protein
MTATLTESVLHSLLWTMPVYGMLTLVKCNGKGNGTGLH